MKVTIVNLHVDLYADNPKESRVTADIKVTFPDGDLKGLDGSIAGEHRQHTGHVTWSAPCFHQVTISGELAQRIRDDFLKIAEQWLFHNGKPEG